MRGRRRSDGPVRREPRSTSEVYETGVTSSLAFCRGRKLGQPEAPIAETLNSTCPSTGLISRRR
jgi:hypothetical protein